MNGHVQTGLVAASSVNDYWADVVKKHEFTRPVKEQDRMNHIKGTGIHAGPVFLTYPDVDEINAIVDPIRVTTPDTNFVSPDGVRHTVWVLRVLATIEQLVTLFKEKVPATYIADGHHRAASASKVGKALQEQNPNGTGEEPYNYFLSVLFPASDGGYVLLGLRHSHPRVFAEITWSSASVASSTRARLAELGWSLFEGPELDDIDCPEDLPKLPAGWLPG